MARAKAALTPERAKSKAGKPGLHLDAAGLYLRVSKSSETSKTAASSWVYRYMLNGKAREMGLGSYPDVTLYAARELAEEARKLKARGVDPIDARDNERTARRVEEAKSVTFQACAEMYIAAHSPGWKNKKHAAQWTATLATYAYPILSKLPVSTIDIGLILKVLEPIWTTKTETASRVRGRIEAVLDWAKGRGYRSGENPARWQGNLKSQLPKRSDVRVVKHHAALPYAQVSGFFEAVAAQEGTAAQALLFSIVTAARTGEVLGAKWAEVDTNKHVWTVPGKRMKGRREHRVPLSPVAMKVLRHQSKVTGGDGYIFPGQNRKKPLSNMAMLMLLDRMNRDDLTVHGFRSTFRDWVEEQTAYPGSVAEAALAHVVGDKVEAAYRRGDLFEKRRQLMDAWASYCTTPASADKVTTLRKRQKVS